MSSWKNLFVASIQSPQRLWPNKRRNATRGLETDGGGDASIQRWRSSDFHSWLDFALCRSWRLQDRFFNARSGRRSHVPSKESLRRARAGCEGKSSREIGWLFAGRICTTEIAATFDNPPVPKAVGGSPSSRADHVNAILV